MVARAIDGVPNFAGMDALECGRRCNERVDAPACAARPAVAAPPVVGIVAHRIGVQDAPSVLHLIGCKHAAVSVALGLGVPRGLIPLLRGPGQVPVVPDDVEVATPHHVARCVGLQVLFQRIVPAHLVVEGFEVVAGIHRVRPDEDRVGKLGGDQPCA